MTQIEKVLTDIRIEARALDPARGRPRARSAAAKPGRAEGA